MKKKSSKAKRLHEIADLLASGDDLPPEPGEGEPFRLILREQVAYLARDDRRAAAFRRLEKEVGLRPEEVAAADDETLESIAREGGGIAVQDRARRMKESARMVLEDFDGDLEAVLDGPVDRALRTLARFPMIGRPGAEKILLFARRHAVLALESNGLRVLVRLGYGREDPRYEKTYASVRTAVSGELRDDFDWLISLHRLLRRHGQDVCRRTRPECDGCLLSQQCPKVGVA